MATAEPLAPAPASPWRSISTKGLSRAEWLEARKTGIGSSDAAAVLGLDPWRSPLEVYLDKRGLLPEFEGNHYTRWGTAIEPLVADWFEQETGKKVRRRLAVLRHPQVECAIADVDRLVVGESAVLEIKTSSAWNRDEWEDGIPARVVLQMQHQMAVTDSTHGYWAVLLGGNDARWGRLERDQELIDQMLRRYQTFWAEHVLAGVEPPVTQPSDVEALRRRFAEEKEGATVLLAASDREALEALAAAKAAAKRAREAEEVAKARVIALLGEAEAAFLPGIDGPVATYRTTHRSPHTVAASSSRTLALKEKALYGR